MTYARRARAWIALLVAVVGFVPAIATSAAASPAPHRTICVGLIVDPQSIGGSVSDSCVNVSPGTTGLDVLNAGGHSLTFRKDGLLCTIDGLPAAGCDDVDNDHYWAYFHRGPDRTVWSYSNEGAATYEPANRSTEGWVYDNGSSLKPENVPAKQICAALLKPSPTPTHTKVHPTPTGSIAHTTAASPKPSATRTHHPVSTTPKAPETVAPTPTDLASDIVTPAPSPAASGGHGSAAGAAVAAAVIAVLIASGVLTTRRRRSGGG